MGYLVYICLFYDLVPKAPFLCSEMILVGLGWWDLNWGGGRLHFSAVERLGERGAKREPHPGFLQ